ncbi:MobC family plasmid mobilization relaxosome protein [Streptomyces sp. McG3]|nr:MobC family plasmid mobilization relaxosome protein [Streptomyces sp. McG3]
MTTDPDSAASCRVRSPYPASAPGEAEASGAEAAPESVGPGVPTEGGTNTPSPLDPHKPVPRRRLRDRQLRERRVHPRYNDHEFDLVQHAAAVSQMAPGGYVAESSLAAARAEDPTAAVADYRATVKALLAANGQLGRVGNNLNQLTGHLNKDGDMPAADTVLRILHRVEASVDAVDGAVARVMEGR